MKDVKAVCSECGWHGTAADLDHVDDPRPLHGMAADRWQVCPKCRTPEHIRPACDEPGCFDAITCGTPLPTGYRSTCSKHAPPPFQRAKS